MSAVPTTPDIRQLRDTHPATPEPLFTNVRCHASQTHRYPLLGRDVPFQAHRHSGSCLGFEIGVNGHEELARLPVLRIDGGDHEEQNATDRFTLKHRALQRCS